MATRRDLPTAAGSANSSSCSSSPVHDAEILEEERKSPSPSSVISSITNKTLNRINDPPTTNCFVEEEDNSSTDEKECRRRFDGDDDASIWKDLGGRFKVTKLSTAVDRKRKTPPPVFTDFFLDDEIKTSIAAAGNQQPPPPRDHHHSEDEITTELGLGWGPYIPIKKTTRRDNDQDPDDDLELRIGPPIQKRRWRRVLFPDGYWEIKKRLTKSDVNGSSRLLLHRQLVEHHVLVHLNHMQEAAINSSNGMEIGVLDVDTDTQHRLVLKLWPSSCCYVLSKNWTCDFVKRRGLSENREIGLRWDSYHSRLEFAVLNY